MSLARIAVQTLPRRDRPYNLPTLQHREEHSRLPGHWVALSLASEDPHPAHSVRLRRAKAKRVQSCDSSQTVEGLLPVLPPKIEPKATSKGRASESHLQEHRSQ